MPKYTITVTIRLEITHNKKGMICTCFYYLYKYIGLAMYYSPHLSVVLASGIMVPFIVNAPPFMMAVC